MPAMSVAPVALDPIPVPPAGLTVERGALWRTIVCSKPTDFLLERRAIQWE
jgi:hypothetical protein